jgi:hypothetical protein
MNRPSLVHPIRSTRARTRRAVAMVARPARAHESAAPLGSAAILRARRLAAAESAPDPDVERVREAGGPVDRATYSCECGYMFSAPVSTTVHCPHCGIGQAW